MPIPPKKKKGLRLLRKNGRIRRAEIRAFRARICQASLSPSFKHALFHKPLSDRYDAEDDKTPICELRESIGEMWLRNEKLKKQISDLENKFDPERLKYHMAVMHRCHEIKNVAEMMSGRVAIKQGSAVKEVLEEFVRPSND